MWFSASLVHMIETHEHATIAKTRYRGSRSLFQSAHIKMERRIVNPHEREVHENHKPIVINHFRSCNFGSVRWAGSRLQQAEIFQFNRGASEINTFLRVGLMLPLFLAKSVARRGFQSPSGLWSHFYRVFRFSNVGWSECANPNNCGIDTLGFVTSAPPTHWISAIPEWRCFRLADNPC